MTRLFAVSALLALTAAPAAAQSTGGFVTMLGRDTIAMESYSWSANEFRGTRIARTPNVNVADYTATLGPDGRVTKFEYSMRPGSALQQQPATERGTITFRGDSIAVAVQRGEQTRNFMTVSTMSTFPMIPFTYALYNPVVRHARTAGRDSANYGLLFPAAVNPMASWVARHGRDSVTIGFFGSPLLASISPAGLTGISGAMTTQAVEVRPISSPDMERAEREWAQAQAEGRAIGQLSPRDTARAEIGESEFWVDYGRPSMRGRKVFGGLVPFGEVWRTGANAATQFTTESPIMFGTLKLQPGTYTLWTLPTANGATLIVNGQTGQWGTDYDKARDLGRVPMTVTTTDAPVEIFTIDIEARGEKRGALVFAWDRMRWEAPFAVE